MKYQVTWWKDDLETVLQETVVQTIEQDVVVDMATDQVIAHVEGEISKAIIRKYLDQRHVTVEPIK